MRPLQCIKKKEFIPKVKRNLFLNHLNQDERWGIGIHNERWENHPIEYETEISTCMIVCDPRYYEYERVYHYHKKITKGESKNLNLSDHSCSIIDKKKDPSFVEEVIPQIEIPKLMTNKLPDPPNQIDSIFISIKVGTTLYLRNFVYNPSNDNHFYI
jgi:hypothetical protein